MRTVAGAPAIALSLRLLEHSGTSTHGAIEATLRVCAIAVLGAAVAVMAVRQHLVRRGVMAPLSMKAQWTPPSS